MDAVKVLTTLPSTDGNFLSALNTASLAQMKYAVQLMKINKNGQNASRIKAIEAKINNYGKAEKKSTSAKKKKSKLSSSIEDQLADIDAHLKESAEYVKANKNKPIEVTPLDKSKKPKIVPFKTKSESGHTYEECKAKLEKELEKYTDNDSAYVVEGILERCKADKEFCNNVMRKDKSYEGFFKYMFNAAQKGYCYKIGNNGGILDANDALELAFDYFSGDEEKTEIKANTSVKKATEKKAEPKKEEPLEFTLMADELETETDSNDDGFEVGDDGQLSFAF